MYQPEKSSKQENGKNIINSEWESHLIKSFTIISRQLFFPVCSFLRLSLGALIYSSSCMRHKIINKASQFTSTRRRRLFSRRLGKIVKFYSYVCLLSSAAAAASSPDATIKTQAAALCVPFAISTETMTLYVRKLFSYLWLEIDRNFIVFVTQYHTDSIKYKIKQTYFLHASCETGWASSLRKLLRLMGSTELVGWKLSSPL